MEQIRTPFTDQEVRGLQAHQDNEMAHSYTCVRHSDQRLIVSRDGLLCGICGYKQTWAYRPFMEKE